MSHVGMGPAQEISQRVTRGVCALRDVDEYRSDLLRHHVASAAQPVGQRLAVLDLVGESWGDERRGEGKRGDEGAAWFRSCSPADHDDFPCADSALSFRFS